jgi:hypothetical protein
VEHRTTQDVIERMPQCFTKYDANDAIQTVRHLIETAAWLSKAICEENQYPFNASQFDVIRTLYDEMFDDAQ